MQTRTLSTLFHISMWWRIFYGLIRIVLGLVLVKLINVPFSDIFYQIMHYEITDEPTNLFVALISKILLEHQFTVTGFIAVYLMFWGILDVVLSLCLLRHKWWAFPVSLVLIALFIFYEIYRFMHTHSLMLLAVICIDIFIYWLIRREHLELQRRYPGHFHNTPKQPVVT